MDAEIELQRVSNNAVKYEHGQKAAHLEASVLSEELTKVRGMLESSTSHCSVLDGQVQDMHTQVSSSLLEAYRFLIAS